jgi:hypothetical protein
MKSPWKLLVQLTSRRRQEDPQQRSTGNESDRHAIESEAQQTPALPPSLPQGFSGSDHKRITPPERPTTTSNKRESDVDGAQAVPLPVAVDEDQAPARDEIPQSGADTNAIVPGSRTSTKSSAAPRTKRSAPAKKDRVQLVARSMVVTELDQSAQSSFATDPFFEVTASLDEEIKQLRRQLAQKLSLQNVQLRKMLERFDCS